MKNIRKNIESLFNDLGEFIYKNKIIVIIIILALTIALGSQLPKLGFDTSTEGFLHEKDPILKSYNEFRDVFGRDEFVLIAIKSDDIFSKSFFEKLYLLHNELDNNVPYLKKINSLINVRNIYGKNDELIVEDLLKDFEEKQVDYEYLKNVVMANSLYRNFVISEDAKVATITIETEAFQQVETGEVDDLLADFDAFLEEAAETKKTENIYLSNEQNSEIVDKVRSITDKYISDDFEVYYSGTPIMTDSLKKEMLSNMRMFAMLSILVIIVALLLIFHRLSGVVFPLIVVISTLVSTFGIMSLLKIPIKLPTQILPSFLLVVGVGASVHILAIFFYNLQNGDDKESSIVGALKHSGLAIVMTSLTTAAGLFSFAFAEVEPVSKLGIFGALGVIISLLYTIFLLPALIALFPIKTKKTSGEKNREKVMDKILMFFVNLSYKHSLKILVISILIIIICMFGILKINFSHDPISWLPDSNSLKSDTEFVNENMKGAANFEVVIDTGVEDGVKDPKVLNNLEKFSDLIKAYKTEKLFIGKVLSINVLLKEINRALNENREEFYSIPQDKNLIAQELLLFEMSGADDLEKLVDSSYQKTRLTMRVPMLDALEYAELVNKIENELSNVFGDKVEITVTGLVPIMSRTLKAVMTSTGKSYIFAFLVITIMMILLIGSLRMGLVSMIPNLFPILFVIGFMGATNIDLDMFVMLVGCIAIGLAVDDTIHFMHNFRRYYLESKDVKKSIEDTLMSTGRAMLTTSVVLCSGFFIYMLSSMSNIFNFGMLTGIAIAVVLLADFILAPALMVLIYKKK